jgi:hypothetical protein
MCWDLLRAIFLKLIWDRWYDCKNSIAKIWPKLALFAQSTSNFFGEIILTLFLRKIPFFAENCLKS